MFQNPSVPPMPSLMKWGLYYGSSGKEGPSTLERNPLLRSGIVIRQLAVGIPRPVHAVLFPLLWPSPFKGREVLFITHVLFRSGIH